ncbi:MAG: rhomboid family intramembrane serine protease [Clostridiales bacterium]|nr:rhomboid family intramembrane serine protease [Clostridiales bacterium]
MFLISIWRQMPPVTKNLIIINAIICLAINLLEPRFGNMMVQYGALHYFTSDDFLVTQFFTYMFLHESFSHLFFNMFALFMFGGIIERSLGSKRYLFYYISCGLGAALIQEGVYAVIVNYYENLIDNPLAIKEMLDNGTALWHQHMTYSDPIMQKLHLLINTPTLGASGAVYGILLAFGVLFPRQPIYLMFIPIPLQARWVVLGYGVIELLQALNNNPADNVAHLAHLGGMIFGLLMLLYWRKKGIIGPYQRF